MKFASFAGGNLQRAARFLPDLLATSSSRVRPERSQEVLCGLGVPLLGGGCQRRDSDFQHSGGHQDHAAAAAGVVQKANWRMGPIKAGSFWLSERAIWATDGTSQSDLTPLVSYPAVLCPS